MRITDNLNKLIYLNIMNERYPFETEIYYKINNKMETNKKQTVQRIVKANFNEKDKQLNLSMMLLN